jgi:hypothetical protein
MGSPRWELDVGCSVLDVLLLFGSGRTGPQGSPGWPAVPRPGRSISGSNINDRSFRWFGLGGLALLAKRNDQSDAGRPGGQHVDHRDKLDGERGQQQRMKADGAPGEEHRDDIDDFIGERPAQRSQQKLERIRADGHCVGESDSISR